MSNLSWGHITSCSLLKSGFYNITLKGKRTGRNLILFYGKTAVSTGRNAIVNIGNGMLHFNRGANGYEPFPGMLEMHQSATLSVNKSFVIKSGAHVIIAKNAQLILGSGFINRNVKIRCFDRIEIGDDVAVSENVTIWDSDAHTMEYEGFQKTQPVKIGNHVWIGTNVTILKGITIGDGAIIAANSLVSKSIPPGCLAAGSPAKVIKEQVEWHG